MPEGPSLVIFKELVLPFKGKKIIAATGNAKINMKLLENQEILDMRTWGKQFFFCLKKINICVHFLMFGSYSFDEQTRPDRSLRLKLQFKKGSIFIYTSAIKIIEEDLNNLYDWQADVMSEIWNPARARKKLKKMPNVMVCDALLDQQIFSGVGNIIKNEVLYRIRLHPETLTGNIHTRKLTELIKEARKYSFDFLRWKKEYVLKKHWLVYAKKTCSRCDLAIIKKYCGKTKRRTFFCENCQKS